MATVPPPPVLMETTAISISQIHVVFQSTGDGGSTVLEWQIGYGTSSNGPLSVVSSGGTSDVGGFESGQRIYFWARGRNAIGWSAWSNRLEANTWRVPDAPSIVYISLVTQTTVRTQFYGQGNGGTPNIDHELGYGTDPDNPTIFLTNTSGIHDLTDLDPGATYYFWARSRNAVGQGPWSPRTQTNLAAGARIFVAGEWKRAVPYIKVSGVWKVAKPWVNNAGVWKETSI